METYSSMVEYINMAKKTINSFSNRICPGIGYQMINSEDAIADVAYAMMYADWKYDKDRKGKISNKSKSKYSYRNQCAIWAIQTYIKNSLKQKTIYLNSLIDDTDNSMLDILEDVSQNNPAETTLLNEKIELQSQLINDIFDCQLLSQSQKDKLRLYFFDGLSLEKIGKKYGITREAVRQNIKNAIRKIQEVFA